jgi:hypothetical protein
MTEAEHIKQAALDEYFGNKDAALASLADAYYLAEQRIQDLENLVNHYRNGTSSWGFMRRQPGSIPTLKLDTQEPLDVAKEESACG